MTVQVSLPPRHRGPPSQDPKQTPPIAVTPTRPEQPLDPRIWRDEQVLWRAMAWFVVPQTAAAVLQLISSTITVVYFGQLLGRSALAVASVFFPIFFLLVSFLIGLISGGIVLVGQAWGAGDIGKMKSVTGTTLSVCALVSIAVAVTGFWLSPELLGLMGTPQDIHQSAVEYARVTFASLPMVTVFFGYTYLLRGTGDARTPFLALMFCTSISLMLMPVLIEGWVGLPAFGVRSAPLANLVACTVSLPALAIYLRWRGHPLAPDRDLLRRLRIDPSVAGTFLAIGVPAGLQLAMTSLSEVAVVSFVNAFGSSATAAYGAINQVVGYVLAPLQGVGLAATVFGAQAVGAGQLGRLSAVTRMAVLLTFVIGATLVGVVHLFAPTILSWFVADPVTQAIAARALLITLWSYVLVGIGGVLAGVMRSTGTVGWPSGLSVAAVWLVQLPVAYLLSHRIGLDGIWIGYPAGFVIGLVAQWIYYAAIWRRQPHRQLA
jgi:putative MATE family efflux protein